MKSSNYYKIAFQLILIFTRYSFCTAQNLEKIGDKKPLKITGGISANQIGYLSNDVTSRRDPYTWVMTGSLNFNLYDWNVPISYTISNYNHAFQQPFNQYSLHPTYKWIQLHAGYCNMTFSPYSLSGHTFLGGGVELAPPGIFRFAAMYGQLQRAISPDTGNINIKPAFSRIGYGIKTGINLEGYSIEATMFRASDDPNSMTQLINDSTIKPQENLVLSLSGKATLIQNLVLTGEIAGSCLTSDKTVPLLAGNDKNIYSGTGLLKKHQSTAAHNAYKTGLNYSFDKSAIGLAYERIDPGYSTLGAYYSNNDFENYTANASTSVFNGKVSLSANSGIQYDDLDNKKASKTSRYVYSLNAAYAATQKLNISGAYSNFSTFTNIRSQFETINQTTPIQNIDTLNYTQLSQSSNVNVSYAISNSETKRQNLSFNFNYMVAKDKQASNISGSDFYTTNVSYSHGLVPYNLTFTGALNSNYTLMPGSKALTIGPSVSVSKLFFEKTLRTSITVSKNNSYSNGKVLNSCFIARFTGGYAIIKKHNLSMSMIYSNRESFSNKIKKVLNDLTGTLSYNYNF